MSDSVISDDSSAPVIWKGYRRSPWPLALVAAGAFLLLVFGPEIWRLYHLIQPMDREASLAIVRNLDQLADMEGSRVGRGPTSSREPIAMPDNLQYPPTQLGLPRSHDVVAAIIGLIAVVLGLSATIRRLLHSSVVSQVNRGGTRSASPQIHSTIRIAFGVWEAVETFSLLGFALLLVGCGYAALSPLLHGAPPSLAPIDREMNGLVASLVVALKPS